MAESTKTEPGATWRRLVIRTYIVTMGATVLITLLSVLFLVDTDSCSSLGRALAVLGATTAVVFLASVAVVGVGVWKSTAGVTERLAIVVGYGVTMLASYVVFTCGLMVVFNC